MSKKNKYGWIRDFRSHLDYSEAHPEIAELLSKTTLKHRVSAKTPPPKIPTKVDLRTTNFFPPVYDQEKLGSCTANAAMALLQYFERKANGTAPDLSRLFLYKVTRNLAQTTGDSGAELRNVMGALVLFGAPPESHWPYDITKFDDEPSAFCYAFAENFKTLKYFRLSDTNQTPQELLDKVKLYIAEGFPSIFGFSCYQPELTLACYNGGLLAYPSDKSLLDGGHAVLACGYDDDMMINGDKGAILFRNSWGAWNIADGVRSRDQDAREIGDYGYFWMSYRYFTEKTPLVSDFWTIIKQGWVDSGQFATSDNS